ncbi:MAG: zf-TFIIB domain-containing protein [Myxococcales bacterium]|jgi:Zn-finger nucleic acid-binding protein
MSRQPLACPCCNSEMQAYQIGATNLDLCGCCDGLWFDGGELEAVVGAPLSAQGSFSQYRACPRCKKSMKRVMLDKTSVEHCEQCKGYFLDADELEEIIASAAAAPVAAAAAGKPPAAAEEEAGPREFDCLKCGKRFPIAKAYSVPGGRICDGCSGFVPVATEPSKLVRFLTGLFEAMPVGYDRRGRFVIGRSFFDH